MSLRLALRALSAGGVFLATPGLSFAASVQIIDEGKSLSSSIAEQFAETRACPESALTRKRAEARQLLAVVDGKDELSGFKMGENPCPDGTQVTDQPAPKKGDAKKDAPKSGEPKKSKMGKRE